MRKARMDIFTIGLAVSAALFVLMLAGALGRSTFGYSDRHVLMRITLAKIARGDYEGEERAIAQQVMDAVNSIDDERVRMYYEGKRG